ncbi:MAG: DUF1186 domain-containing protein [Desulfobacteraceae bacterium]|nr:DUF1186 domain-containing protein [Desulfobacteraceae bacterium]
MEQSQPISLDDILSAFRTMDGVYKRDMVEAALQRREEIVPRLIAILEEAVADPDRFLEEDDRFDHVYAVVLLRHFRAAEAHPVIVAAFSLPEKQVDYLFGDMITEDLPTILLHTCGGSISALRAMILDPKVLDFCRASALQAIVYAVAEGYVPRQEIIELAGTLFTGSETQEGSDFWSFAAEILSFLQPREIMPVIEQAYENGLIYEDLISLEDFESVLSLSPEEAMEGLKRHLEKNSPKDIHASISSWACFRGDNDLMAPAGPADLFGSGLYGDWASKSAGKKAQTQKKKKRKQAKAAKRKNRR